MRKNTSYKAYSNYKEDVWLSDVRLKECFCTTLQLPSLTPAIAASAVTTKASPRTSATATEDEAEFQQH